MQGYNFIVLSTTSNEYSDPANGVAQRTPLAAAVELGEEDLAVFCGVQTPRRFDVPSREIDALFSSAGVFDLGWRGKILVTGGDRLRWLNGMVTNTVQGLPVSEGHYSFLLSAQGRIQGDCYLYRRADDLILDTSRDQIPALLRHLNHFIIMDEVELADVSDRWTGLGLAGPKAPTILESLGLISEESFAGPGSSPEGNAKLHVARTGEIEITVIETRPRLTPRYELWIRSQDVGEVWEIFSRHATTVGLEAIETLRVLEGVPLFGVDLNDRDLPQETGQTRALNFTKGCYLGQEIVERIRSRGKVHRQFRQFALEGRIAPLPFDLRSGDQVVGRITSSASVSSTHISGNFGLGIVREESLAGQSPLHYEGGVATPLEAPPHISAA
jgi:folate-binding protein YgfZ